MTHDNKLQVEAIKRGTVIDHVPAQVGFKLLTLFKLTETCPPAKWAAKI